jgi:hypothetical protein
MTDQWGFDPNTTDEFGQPNNDNTPKGLRTWAESVNKENKALKDTLNQIQAELQQQKIGNTFAELGISPQAATLYSGEPTKEAVSAWADTMRNVFGVQGATPQVSQTPPAPTLTGEQQSSFQDFVNAGANGTPSTSIDDFQRGVNQATSQADLIALFSQMK